MRARLVYETQRTDNLDALSLGHEDLALLLHLLRVIVDDDGELIP